MRLIDADEILRKCNWGNCWYIPRDAIEGASTIEIVRGELISREDAIEDIPKLCSICEDLGYLGAVVDEYSDDLTGSNIADEITEYIVQLFNIKSSGEE